MAAYCACRYHTLRVRGARDWQDGLNKNESHPRSPHNVPKLMRRAQIELGVARSEAITDLINFRPKKWLSTNIWNPAHASEPWEVQKAERKASFGRPLLARSAQAESSGCASSPDFPRFGLHDMLDRRGLDTGNARAARDSFAAEIFSARNHGDLGDGASAQLESAPADLARAALEIAAEDDALISHSPVPLPVDAYLARLDSMAAELAGHHLLPNACDWTPEAVFRVMDSYIYGYMGFSRSSLTGPPDARDYYLNGVLTRRVGTPVMLALIYSELASRLQRLGAIPFGVQMEVPFDLTTLPRPRVAGAPSLTGGEEGRSVVLTPKLLLYEVLRGLKDLYWPWRTSRGSSGGSGFVEAAAANSRGGGMGIMGPTPSTSSDYSSGAEVAAARLSGHRLQRGIWSSAGFGDMRRALAVSERLVLLGVEEKEGRDYGVLLLHCGLYPLAQTYLGAYAERRHQQLAACGGKTENVLDAREDAALQSVLQRVHLILAERAWSLSPHSAPPEPLPEPW